MNSLLISAFVFLSASAAVLADGTEADIQRVVDASVGGEAVVPAGRYEIAKAIALPSHTHLKIAGCHLRMKDGVFAQMFSSVGTEDVTVDGGGTAVLDGGEPNGLNEDTSRTGGFPHISQNLTFCFIGVKDVAVKNLEIRDHRWWAMMFTFCERGRVGGIRFRLTRHRIDQGKRLRNQDGIDIRVGCSDFVVEDISGETGDDVVAMTALGDKWVKDVYDAGVRSRDIHHVCIRRINAVSVGCSLVRLLAHYGQRIHDIDIRDVAEAGGPGETSPAQSAIRIGDRVPPYYGGKEENAQRFGDISDIFIDGVRTRACTAVQTDDGIRNLTVRNVTLDRDGGSVWIVGGYTMTPGPFLYLPELESKVREQTFVRGYPSAWNIRRRDTVRCENVRFENITADSKPHFDEALFRFSDAEFVDCSVSGVTANGRRLTEVSNCRNLPKTAMFDHAEVKYIVPKSTD